MADKKLDLDVVVSITLRATNADGSPFSECTVGDLSLKHYGVPLPVLVALQQSLVAGGTQIVDDVMKLGADHAAKASQA